MSTVRDLQAVDQAARHRLRVALRVAAADYGDLEARIKYDSTLSVDDAVREAERIGSSLAEDIRKVQA